MWAFNWAPRGWHLCDGAVMQIQQNAALFGLLGTQFGGDGRTTFNLPDLRGRTPIGTGISPEDPATNYVQGTKAGAETVTLQATNVPPHTHLVEAFPTNGTATFPADTNFFANVVKTQPTTTQQFNVYLPNTATAIPNPQTLGTAAAPAVSPYGGGQPHANMQPFLVVNFCICVDGLWPSRP